jgi:hypothetical protein
MIRTIIAAIALLTPSFAAAEEIYEDFKNGWSVRVEEGLCLAVAWYKNGDALLVSYNPSTDRAALMISVPDATSLTEGDIVELHVIFRQGQNLDDWGAIPFKVGKHKGVSQMMGGFEGRRMIRDIGRRDAMVISIDGTTERLVNSYSLVGSAAAMDSLRRCAFEQHGLNPNDPFLR